MPVLAVCTKPPRDEMKASARASLFSITIYSQPVKGTPWRIANCKVWQVALRSTEFVPFCPENGKATE